MLNIGDTQHNAGSLVQEKAVPEETAATPATAAELVSSQPAELGASDAAAVAS